MKSFLRACSLYALITVCLVTVITCDTPFALGSRVNTAVPVIRNPPTDIGLPDAVNPGSYLKGTYNVVYLDVEQEFGIDYVFVTCFYTDLSNEQKEKIFYAYYDEDAGYWAVVIDTTGMADGGIMIQVTAVDVSGKVTTSTEIVYTVKNAMPQVELTMPKIRGDGFDDPDININLSELPVYEGGRIMGIASDASGIRKGYPQVMLWPDNHPTVDANGIPTDPKYGVWRTAVDDSRQPLSGEGVKAVQFFWPLLELIEDGSGGWRLPQPAEAGEEDLPPGNYRFKVRVMDEFGEINTYPNRRDNSLGIPESSAQLKKYMEINVIAATNPIISPSVPQYYNGKGPFIATMRISSSNAILVENVYARVENSDDVTFNIPDSYVISRTSGSDYTAFYRAEIPLDNIPDTTPGVKTGPKVLHIQAVDIQGNTTATSRAFIIDNTPPVMEYVEPAGFGDGATRTEREPAWPQVTSTVRIRGSAIDDQRVSRLYYALGKTEIAAADSSDDPNTNTGWTDTLLHTASPLGSPHPGPGTIRARWEGSLSSWTWRFEDISDVSSSPTLAQTAAGNYYVENSDFVHNMWLLPIKFKVVDVAGNVGFYEGEMIVDPDADAPSVTITSHTDGQVVGGMVRVNGIAIDNDMIHSVWYRVLKQSDAESGTENMPSEEVHGFREAIIVGKRASTVSWYLNINEDDDLTPPDSAPFRRVLLEVKAGDASLYDENTFKHFGRITRLTLDFNQAVPTIRNIEVFRNTTAVTAAMHGTGEPYKPGAIYSNLITLKTTVRDDSGITSIMLRNQGGVYAEVTATAPNTTTPWVTKPPVITTGGTIVQDRKYWIIETGTSDFLEFQENDDTPSNTVDKVFIASKGGSITGTGKLVEATILVGTLWFFEYHVYIPCDTNPSGTGFLNNRYKDKAGVYSVDIQATDNTGPLPYIARNTFILQIDNFYPMAEFNAYINAVGEYAISGRAWDSVTDPAIDPAISVSGIDRVVVYFTRGSTGISLKEKAGTSPFNNSSQQARTGRTGSSASVTNAGSLGPLPVFPNLQQQLDGTFTSTDSGIVVSGTGLIGGYQQVFTGENEKEWTVYFNSDLLNSGPVNLNYVVFDMAGNASWYEKPIYIANNRPRISAISLGTDINGNSVVADGSGTEPNEYLNYGNGTTPMGYNEVTTDFRSRNSSLNFKFNVLYGNGQNRYKVSHVTRDTPAVPASGIVKGNVYTIADVGDLIWRNYGVFDGPISYAAGVTFVATASYPAVGESATTSTVYTYSTVGTSSNTEKTGNVVAGTTAVFNSSSFGATQIADSAKVFNTQGGAVLQRDKLFLVKVYDSTTSGSEDDQLAHVIPVNMDVDNTDVSIPQISINPFHWNSAADNSLYLNSRANGHIELETNLPAAFTAGGSGISDRDPKISGKVSFRGTAFDTNKIGSISFSISNFPAAAAATTGASFASGAWTPAAADIASDGWQFVAETVTHNQEGHSVKWQLDFDSVKITNVASLENTLLVTANDGTNNSVNPGSAAQTSAALKTGRYKFDVVPYISSISTPDRNNSGLKDINIRSADGRYSIMSGSANASFITVTGFNLNAASVRILNSTANTSYRGNPASIPAGISVTPSAMALPYTSFTMPNNFANSGYLTVVVNSIGNLNNINNNDSLGGYSPGLSMNGGSYEFRPGISNGADEVNMPNREADRYITKNITLTDDRYLRFFHVRSARASIDSGMPLYPDMLVVDDNPVFAYLNPGGGPSSNPAKGPGTGAGSWHPGDAWPQRREVDGTTGAEIYTEYLAKAANWSGMGMARDDSGRYLHASTYSRFGGTFNLIYDRYAEFYGTGSAWMTGVSPGGMAGGHSGNYATAVSLEPVSYGDTLDPFRYQYPKIIAKGNSNPVVTSDPTGTLSAALAVANMDISKNGAVYFMLYLDSVRNELVFRNFIIRRRSGASGGAAAAGWTRLDYTTAGWGTGNSKDTWDNESSTHKPFSSRFHNEINMAKYSGGNATASNGATATDVGAANNTGNTRHTAVLGSVSRFFDIGVSGDNRAVIVYYDGNETRLKLRYSSNTLDGSSPTVAPSWTDSGLSFPVYVGQYVSVEVNGNALHIAAMDANNNDLIYFYIPDFRNGQSGNTLYRIPVDSSGNVGFWAQVKIHPVSGLPYISYYNTSESGTRESLKVAYPKQAITNAQRPGVDSSGYTTGYWEYMTMPALNPPDGGKKEFQKVSLGFRVDGRPVLGYLSTDFVEFGYPIDE